MIIRERYMDQLRDFIDTPVIKVLTGMRRSGKSALLELLKEELFSRNIPATNIISINLESLRYESLREYHALYQELLQQTRQTTGKVYILLDEIQEVSDWESS